MESIGSVGRRGLPSGPGGVSALDWIRTNDTRFRSSGAVYMTSVSATGSDAHMKLLRALMVGDLSEADRLAGPVLAEMARARLEGDTDLAAQHEALLARLPCRHPVPMRYDDESSGRSGVVGIRCGSRSVLSCPSCARLYRGDVRAVVYSGLRARVDAGERFVLLTLTAPSFGEVHRVLKSPTPGAPPLCKCGRRHRHDSPLRGVPIDLTSYDYSGAVDFNGCAPRLFTRTTDALSDWLARATGTSSARLSYVRVAEWQSRGLIHFHVLISLPPSVSEVDLGVTGADRRFIWSEPDSQRASTLERICAGVSTSSPSGRTLRWGAQLHADVIGSEEQAYRASGYMSKVINYVLKDVVAAGTDGDDEEMPYTPSPDEIVRRSHIRRMSQAAHAWRCGRPGGGADGARHRRCCEAHNSRLQRSYRCRGSGHRSFGWHGRVFSTSRDWSPDRLSLTRCRRRRQDYCSRARGSVLGDSVVWRHASAMSWLRDARRIRGEIEHDPGTALAWAPPDPGSGILLDGG